MSELFALGRKREIRSLRRRSADAFALTYRCQAPSHRCLARILISGGVPEYPKGISSGGTLCHRQGTSSRHCSLGVCRSTPWKLMSGKAFSSTGSPPRRRKVRELRFRLWAKSSVHFLVPEGNPLGGLLLSPPNPLRWALAGPHWGDFERTYIFSLYIYSR